MNDRDSKTNLVAKFDELFRMIVGWGTTHEEVDQNSKCPIVTMRICWADVDVVAERTDVACDHVTNDHRCILLDKEAMFRHMTSQLVDVL